jgi:predicted enzyme related to lactoylglutathione lyase
MSVHSIVHIELSAKDREVSGKFYSDVFGWKVEQTPEMNYATFETGEGVGGGFNPVSDQNPAGSVVVYIGTDDIDASLAAVEKHGGKTVAPKGEIPGYGWFAIFLDPAGNLVGLYTAAAIQ